MFAAPARSEQKERSGGTCLWDFQRNLVSPTMEWFAYLPLQTSKFQCYLKRTFLEIQLSSFD